jgi:hypothetical protein
MQLAVDPSQLAADPGVGSLGAVAQHRIEGSIQTQLEGIAAEAAPHGSGHATVLIQGDDSPGLAAP